MARAHTRRSTMFSPMHDFHKAIHQARVATRQRDLKQALHWMRLAEQHVRLFERMLSAEERHRRLHGYVLNPNTRNREGPMPDRW
jgi:hypothetical protein